MLIRLFFKEITTSSSAFDRLVCDYFRPMPKSLENLWPMKEAKSEDERVLSKVCESFGWAGQLPIVLAVAVAVVGDE